MWHIYQFPLCPFSRKLRLLMSEKGIAYELRTAWPWKDGELLFQMNPAGRTPVIRDESRDNLTLSDSRAICEYFEETVDRQPLISGTAQQRAEQRRLIAMFDENFFDDVGAPLLQEKMIKRLMGNAPVAGALRDAMKFGHDYLDYLDYLIDHRPWLAGPTMTLADLTAAAHISVADYLGGLDWSSHEQAKGWYMVIKSRPSFGPLLKERMDVIQPPSHYSDVDV
ncbi:glutathione S-transferase [Novosphingobium sp. PC22D]|uniref:glutathione S-transferase family protein n=1 Tax=Novosphingobium sp. PC22D TaxID=1962403 RepID=UPI000BF0B32F|nr:glutathione S-transferase family protein [Novosphingobium sp. PC22D]PEQ13553.1 glutathione S-transferase [Novosphingobium sp. PC22D]